MFGWRFQPFGPPDCFTITTGTEEDPAIRGALHSREYSVVGKGIIGYECTVSVSDLEATLAAVEANGRKVVMPKTAIPGVSWLIKFLDTDGNVVCAMRYDKNAK